MSVTETAYSSLDYAFQYFNTHLFDGALPDSCLLTLQRKGGDGYFSPDKFKSRTDTAKAHEIALNPDKFDGKGDVEILAVLVHQMCHLWEWMYYRATNQTKEPAKGYHSRRWANKMIHCGLMPSHTGRPRGKQTGTHVSQYILEDGLFDLACQRLFSENFKLHWESLEKELGEETTTKKSKKKQLPSKVKYSCPVCGQNAWAKPNAQLDCGACHERTRVVVHMSSELLVDEDADIGEDLQEWSDEELNRLDLVPIAVPVSRQLHVKSVA